MSIAHYYIYLSFGWVGFCLIHSFFAAHWVKKIIARSSGRYFVYYRLLFSCCSLILLIFLLRYQAEKKETPLFFVNAVVQTSAVILISGGSTIMMISAVRYFIPVTGVAIFTKQKAGEVLLDNGIHRVIRHPLYAGTVLLIWGLFLIFPFTSNLIATMTITAYTFIGIRLEEKKLLLQFGKKYDQYRRRVPMIIPKLHLRRSKRRTEDTGPEFTH